MSGSEGSRPVSSTTASALVGANPRSAVARVSTAVRCALLPLTDEGGTAVVLAVSGGADSLALGVCALDVCSRVGIPVLSLTVDHGLRKGSDAEAARVADLMGALGGEARTVRVEVGARGGREGPEGAARAARLHALEGAAREWAREGGAARALVLLGHTMDDQAETVLLGLARGSGAGSLRGMAPMAPMGGDPREAPGAVPVWAVRPLLGVRRSDTRACCTQLGLDWVEDPTNRADGPWRAADGSALRRAAVREGALPALAQALGVDPVPALARSAQLMARDDDALEEEAVALRSQVLLDVAEATRRIRDGVRRDTSPVPSPPADALLLDARALSGARPAVHDRVLHAALVEVSSRAGSVTAHHVRVVGDLVTAWHGQGPLDVPGAGVVRLPGGVLALWARI